MTESGGRNSGPTSRPGGLFGARLAELAEQKRSLIAQGEVHRAMVDLRLVEIRERIPFLGTAERLLESRRSWWPVVAAGAGLALAARGKGIGRLFKAGLALWPLLKRWL